MANSSTTGNPKYYYPDNSKEERKKKRGFFPPSGKLQFREYCPLNNTQRDLHYII
jgi:hypothetical protein